MTQITADHIDAAIALIDTPDKWIRGKGAKDKSNFTVAPNHPSACKFCMGGALARVLNTYDWVTPLIQLHEQGVINNTCEVWHFNDAPYNSHADIINYMLKLKEKLQ